VRVLYYNRSIDQVHICRYSRSLIAVVGVILRKVNVPGEALEDARDVLLMFRIQKLVTCIHHRRLSLFNAFTYPSHTRQSSESRGTQLHHIAPSWSDHRDGDGRYHGAITAASRPHEAAEGRYLQYAAL